MKTEARRQEQWREAVEQKHQQSLRAAAESLNIARETAHTLSMQSEQLTRTERAVDDTQHAVDLSKRVLRGMTWSGWLYNAFSSQPAPQNAAENQKQQVNEIAMGFICPECKVQFSSPEQLATHYTNTHDQPSANAQDSEVSKKRPLDSIAGSRPSPDQLQTHQQQQEEDPHERFLRDLEPQLAELKQVSLALGNTLDMQNHQLGRLDTKIDRVHHDMKRVSMQTKTLAGAKLPIHFRFRCAIQEVATQKFLRDMDGEARLSADVVVDGCAFRAYTLGEDNEMWGFQSEKSSLFLGVNRYGYLKVKGADFQSYEQFSLNLQPKTPIFCLSSYFGLGGWLAVKQSDQQMLTIIRGTPENKARAAQFHLVMLDSGLEEASTTRR